MARYFARIIRAIIVSSLGFGGGIGLLTFIAILVTTGKQEALGFALQTAIILGLVFGFFSALVLLLSDLTSRLFAAHGFREEIWELEQKREFEVEGALKDARILSRKALLAVPNVKAVADEDNEYAIRASVGASWKSPGEAMRVEIEPADAENRWRVKCISTCLSSNIAFDYGKNFENVEAWLRSMNGLVAEQQKQITGS
jgi:hypothetical protein